MTIREILQRRMKRVVTISSLSFAGIVIGGIGGHDRPILAAIGLGFFALAFLTMMWASFKLNCPKCDGRLMSLLGGVGGNPLKLSPKIQVCPYCRAEFDQPFDQTPS